MHLNYRLFRRRNGVFYWQSNDSRKQGTLRTADRRKAECLLNAMNESHRVPIINLNLARAYLVAHDPKMVTRTWQHVMNELATHGVLSTQETYVRHFRNKAFDSIRHRPLVQTTGEELLAVIHANGNCVAHYVRGLHSFAISLGWLAWPILANRAWPKIYRQGKRAITVEEHRAIVASEKNPERRAYYELLYEPVARRRAARFERQNIARPNRGPYAQSGTHQRTSALNDRRQACRTLRPQRTAIWNKGTTNYRSPTSAPRSQSRRLPRPGARARVACGLDPRNSLKSFGQSSRAVQGSEVVRQACRYRSHSISSGSQQSIMASIISGPNANSGPINVVCFQKKSYYQKKNSNTPRGS